MTFCKNIKGFNATYQIIMQLKLISNNSKRIHKTEKKKLKKRFP